MNSWQRTFVLLFVSLCTGAAAQSYWDEIELIDGQVLRGVVIDTVKDTKVIQLTTRDFISLPAASVVRTVTAQERRNQAEAKAALPPVKVDLNLAVVTSGSPGWKASWAAVKYQTSQSLGIELEDGQVFEANWLDTTRGQAALLLADGRILLIDRSSIRRVTAVTAPAPALAAAPAAPAAQASPAEPEAPAPDLLTPFLAGVAQSLEVAFAGAPGDDPAPFRSFFVPTSRLAAPGRLQVHQLDGAATQVTLGLTDYLQVQASSVLPTLAAADLPSFWQAGAQVALPLTVPGSGNPLAWLSLGQWAGELRTDRTWSGATFFPFLNFTVRTERAEPGFEGTVLGGYVVRPQPQSAQAVLGTSVRLDAAPGVAVMAEFLSSFSVEEKSDSRASGVVGVRLWHVGTALDLGVQAIRQSLWQDQWTSNGWWGGHLEKAQSDTMQILPTVNLSLRF